MANFAYKFKTFSFESIPGDVQISLVSYLADAVTGLPFNNSIGTISLFTIQTLKSSLPGSGYQDYFTTLAESYISSTYTVSSSANTVTGNQLLDTVSTGTSGLIVGQSVSGLGIQVGATIESIRDSSSLRISQAATATATGTTITFGTQGWTIDYSSLAYLVTVVDFGAL